MSDFRTGVSDAPVTPRSPGSWDARSAAALVAPAPVVTRATRPEPVHWPEPAAAPAPWEGEA